jgi:predicted transcriptional regulator
MMTPYASFDAYCSVWDEGGQNVDTGQDHRNDMLRERIRGIDRTIGSAPGRVDDEVDISLVLPPLRSTTSVEAVSVNGDIPGVSVHQPVGGVRILAHVASVGVDFLDASPAGRAADATSSRGEGLPARVADAIGGAGPMERVPVHAPPSNPSVLGAWGEEAPARLGASVSLAAHGAGTMGSLPEPGIARLSLLVGAGILTLALLHRLAARDAVLRNAVRRRAYDLAFLSAGGVTPAAAAQSLGVAPTTASYHLRILEAHGLLVSQPMGRQPVFYVNGRHRGAAERAASRLLGSDERRRLLAAIQAKPSTTLRSLARDAGLSLSAAYWAVGQLEEHGLVAVERRPRGVTFQLSEAARAALEGPVAKPESLAA